MTFFGLKQGQELENPPTKNSKEYPPPPSQGQDDVSLLHKICNGEQSVKHRIKFRSYL